ncbi:DUF4625 domain-containing protein [Hymenobacter aerilatus]|uniref:DUF4625 domain-containing protein n=1 Tax=Hymenobacter aerilatus TaxID=2932251 RepID=A0A8T9SYL2_9BACT|nr:DUF4625 domain-containing protein [Hymenobacter aerilatus]UOR06777.1 DUF4625 domain-containing protein [Hymenobacter aerilatus]
MKKINHFSYHLASALHTTRTLLALLLFATLLSACNDDNEPTPAAQPTISNVEIGLGNNEMGTIGGDFHLNADIVAGDKIDLVTVKIQQRAGETYAKTWQHEIVWEQYKGAKNTTVHKHFDIPADAAEGKYDFLIIVTDENGTKLEEKRSLTIYKQENMPVNPTQTIFNVFKNDLRYYRRGVFATPGEKLAKGDKLTSQVAISGVKGDGKMYLLLINKKLNHRPESIEQIDFSKAIVYDVVEHKNMAASGDFSNSTSDPVTNTAIRDWPNFTIGGTTDNNAPTPNAISGSKAWESGTYYYGVVYKNTTYNISFFQYIEVPIEL